MFLKNISPRTFYLASLLLSAGTLASVFVMQYGFGLVPCELCQLQRLPYAAAILVAAVALALARRQRIFLGMLAGIFLLGTGFGIYHAGVEKSIFQGPSACTSAPHSATMTLEELKARIMSAPRVACNQPQWEWRGITLAGLNAIWSFVLFAGLAYGTYRHRHE